MGDDDAPAPPVKQGDRFPLRICSEYAADSCLSTKGFLHETSPAMPDASIQAIGKILENLNPVLYRVALPNGKPILAHLSKPLTQAEATFAADDKIIVELTPFDFDQARILGMAE
ncbi:MAG TPA: hypothetical protein VF258_01800 [Luteolibacter sp.]